MRLHRHVWQGVGFETNARPEARPMTRYTLFGSRAWRTERCTRCSGVRRIELERHF